MGVRIKAKRKKAVHYEPGADLADFIEFAAANIARIGQLVFVHVLGHFKLWIGDGGWLYCEYVLDGVANRVGTRHPSSIETIAALIEASHSRAHENSLAAQGGR